MKNKKEKIEKRGLDYYLSLIYPVKVTKYRDGGYFAEIPDLPGCMTEADNLEEIMEMIEDAKRSWIEVAFERGLDIPLPETEKEYSGKFIVRVPKSLHASLVRKASDENVSLNQYVSFLLASNLAQSDFKKVEKEVEVLANIIEELKCSLKQFRWEMRFSFEKKFPSHIRVNGRKAIKSDFKILKGKDYGQAA